MSAPKVNQSRQLANDLRKSHFTLGNAGPNSKVSEYVSEYQRKNAQTAQIQSQGDKLNLRGSHFQLGTGDTMKGLRTVSQRDYQAHSGFHAPSLNEDKKRDLRSSHFVLGNHNTQFTTLNQTNYQQKYIPVGLHKQEQEEQKSKMRKHNHNFNETGKKNFASEYNASFKQNDPEFLKQGLTPQQLQQKVLDLRQSNVILGADYKPYQTVSQADFTAKKSHLMSAANDNVAIRRTNFKLGDAQADMSSVYQDYYVAHPTQKSELQSNLGQDLRASHFTLGQEAPMYATNTGAAYRGPPVGFKPAQALNPNLQKNHFSLGHPDSQLQNKTTYSNFHKDFGNTATIQARDQTLDRGSNFSLGGQKGPWVTEAQSHFKAHEGAKAADLDSALKADLRGSHFKFNDVKTNQFQTTQKASYVPKVGEPNKLDEALKKDLQTNHFQLGNQSNFYATSSGTAFQAHNGKPSALDPHLAKDLRTNHFTYGNGKWPMLTSTEYRSNFFWKDENEAAV